MPKKKRPLTRREAQIMEVLHRLGRATAADVMGELDDAPGYSSVRKLLEILETKGHVKHTPDGPRYLYSPVVPRLQAGRAAMEALVRTFFSGSTDQAFAALLEIKSDNLSEDELTRIVQLAERSHAEGR